MRSLILFSLIALCSCNPWSTSHTRQQRSHNIEAVTKLVDLIANYSPDDAEKKFDEAKSFLEAKSTAKFVETHLDNELQSIKSFGRSQTFTLVKEEPVEYLAIDSETANIAVDGFRVRSVKERTSKPIYVSYIVVLQTGSEGNIQISDIDLIVAPNQAKELSEERLLEQLNQVSELAKDERKKFVETVNMVSKDLKEHEKKVEKDFNRLSESIDKLGGTVRKLKTETIKLRERRSAQVAKTDEKSKKVTASDRDEKITEQKRVD